MRRRKAARQLRRTSEQKPARRRGRASALIEHGAIETTEAKAKELRPFIEKLITKARSGTLHDRRLAGRHIHKRETADHAEILPGYPLRATPRGDDCYRLQVLHYDRTVREAAALARDARRRVRAVHA